MVKYFSILVTNANIQYTNILFLLNNIKISLDYNKIKPKLLRIVKYIII